MFVDASALVAIFAREPEAESLSKAIDDSEEPITSAIAVFETAQALSRTKGRALEKSRGQIERFLSRRTSR